jgi:hypothetical protein
MRLFFMCNAKQRMERAAMSFPEDSGRGGSVAPDWPNAHRLAARSPSYLLAVLFLFATIAATNLLCHRVEPVAGTSNVRLVPAP